jgi:uncharacterized membrane protein YdjX (TVP38/TMEM64 family)
LDWHGLITLSLSSHYSYFIINPEKKKYLSNRINIHFYSKQHKNDRISMSMSNSYSGGYFLKKKYVSFFTLLLSLTLVIVFYPKLQHPYALQAFIKHWGSLSLLIDLLVIALLMLFPVVPFILIAGVNTILYGWIGGFLLSLSGSLIGAALGFWLSRTLGQAWAQPKVAKLGKWSKRIEENSFTIIFLSRLVPILPSAAVNYAAGLSLISFPSFLLATLLGKFPMIMWESWVGHDFWKASTHPGRFLIALGIGGLLFGTVAIYWYTLDKSDSNNK